MARIVKKISSAGSYDAITHTPQDYYTQTPGNYSIDNYYLRELQDKVDAEWNYRPNRVQVEYETKKDSGEWEPIEVVAQSIKNEKSKVIAEDYLNLVFRNIQEARFDIGHKFKFSRVHDINSKEKDKNIWLVINRNLASMTSSVVVQRCNGTLASQWIDEQGVAHNHYEPAILSGELNSVNLFYNAVADSPQAHLVVTVQQNDFTSKYKMNQRFILGVDSLDAEGKKVAQVYRIKTIDSFYGLTTHDPNDVGLVKLYMEITESSKYDNFETRIAYQENSTVVLDHGEKSESGGIEPEIDSPIIVFSTPKFIPTELGSEEVNFTPVLKNSKGEVIEGYNQFVTTYELENCPVKFDKQTRAQIDIQSQYIEFTQQIEEGVYSFDLKRKRIYLNGNLIVTCKLPAEFSPTQEDIITTFKLVVSKQEV